MYEGRMKQGLDGPEKECRSMGRSRRRRKLRTVWVNQELNV